MASAKKYRLRVEVRHDGERLEAGSICPEQFVEPLLKQGLLEQVSGKASPVPGNVGVSAPPVVPVGDASGDVEGDESEEDGASDESEGEDEESEGDEGDESEVVEQPKAPAKRAPAKRAVKKAS